MTQSQLALSRAATVVALSLFGTTSGYQGWPGSNTLVDGDAVRFSQQTWRSHLAHPDAVGEYPVRGFDISKEWPDIQKEGAGSIHEVSGWKLAVNVSRSIPASEVQNNGTSLGAARFPNATAPSSFTGTSISLKGPDAVVQSIFGDDTKAHITKVEHATTWKVCVTVATDYNGDKKNASGTYNYGRGVGCDGLSAQCIAEFEQAYAEHFAATQDCAGHPPPTPASCGGALDAASLRTIQYPLDSVNGTELYVTASDAHAVPRNMSMPSSAMSKTWNSSSNAAAVKSWPVLVVWGWNRRANIVEEEIDGTEMMLKPLAQLSCIKAAAKPSNNNNNGSGNGNGSCNGNNNGNGNGNDNGNGSWNGNGNGNGNGNDRPTPTPTATPTTAPESSAAIITSPVESSTLTGLALLTVALSFVLFC
ncbi:hypothetical protein PGQ11_010539 [Apiospora arundinis]|uniref:Uncharacterized protein n=1 Tax=Apiospora arundinis TaxID=335852 RepID=A0ABR2IAV5_9PEZI